MNTSLNRYITCIETEERDIVKKTILCQSPFKDKTIEFKSCFAGSELSYMKHGKIFLDFEDEDYMKEQEYLISEDAPNEIEETTRYVNAPSTTRTVTNLAKAKHQINQLYLNGSDELIGADLKWQPCGGTYVTKVINHFFIVEVNIDGLEIKEISETFYNSFIKEFG